MKNVQRKNLNTAEILREENIKLEALKILTNYIRELENQTSRMENDGIEVYHTEPNEDGTKWYNEPLEFFEEKQEDESYTYYCAKKYLISLLITILRGE